MISNFLVRGIQGYKDTSGIVPILSLMIGAQPVGAHIPPVPKCRVSMNELTLSKLWLSVNDKFDS
jgi:hypothetical protein